MHELYLPIWKRICYFSSSFMKPNLVLLVEMLTYFLFLRIFSSCLISFNLSNYNGSFFFLVGVWDCATGAWCSIWVLLWGIRYFACLFFFCFNIRLWLVVYFIPQSYMYYMNSVLSLIWDYKKLIYSSKITNRLDLILFLKCRGEWILGATDPNAIW